MNDEVALWREFVSTKREGAFEGILRLHLNLVFGTALRQVGDRALAEEVTQNVFLALAQKPPGLGASSTLAGWLYQTTINQSRMVLRSELRRRKREEVAAGLAPIAPDGDSVWAGVIPLLDEALLSIGEKDRVAVALRYMEDRPFRDVGKALGVGEDAARKRIDRVIDQLSEWFRARGFAVSGSALAAALSIHSAQAISPAKFAAIASQASAATTISILGLIMASTKMKVAAIALVTIATISIPLALRGGKAPVKAPTGAEHPAAVAVAPPPESFRPPPVEPAQIKSTFQRINEGDMSLTMLPQDVVEAYLAQNKTNAQSLLIAYRVTHNNEYMRQALERYPNDTNVLFRAIVHDAAPEQRRELLDRYKAADPHNALAPYLSAAEHLKNGNLEQGYADLQEAAQRPEFRDDITAQILNLEDIYLAAGFSPAEAKALGMSAVEMPHVPQLRQLTIRMAELMSGYAAGGDGASAERMAQIGLGIANHLRSVQDGGNLLGEMVALVTERDFLRRLDPEREYDFVPGGVTARLNEFQAREQAIRADSQFMEQWLVDANPAEIINYFDRLKLYGEAAALTWLRERHAPE